MEAVAELVGITIQTLSGRTATAGDLAAGDRAIANGVSNDDLPLTILQSTTGQDLYRLGLLSAYSLWSNAQWPPMPR